MSQKLRDVIDQKISGEVFATKEMLDFYSVDSSAYQIKPKLVVFPKNSQDIINIIRIAKKRKIAITPRGAGTGLVGSALGNGIILDLKYFDSIKVLKNSVIVGPGVVMGELNKALKKHKKFFSPNPSVGPYCTVGGMIGTNAGGSRSLKYGTIVDNLLEVSMITSDEKIITLPKNRKLSNSIFNLTKRIDKNTYPKVTKNSCGYRLDAVSNSNESHKVIPGSEGTLGIITSAKLKIHKIPPSRRLVILWYKNEKLLSEDCIKIEKLNPSALEFVDHTTAKNIPEKFPKSTKCLLFVEFDSNLKKNLHSLKKTSKEKILFEIKRENEIQKWWKYRDSALHFSLKNISKGEKAPHIIEDATVPITRLEELFQIINQIKKISKSKAVVYGHAGNGNLHVRLISKNLNKKFIKKISKYYFTQVLKIDGSITGEHGDGLARSEFVKKQYSSKTYQNFVKVKKLFDKENLLNPNKIISTESTIVKHLNL